jgi:myo-inositol-1(or 4)-monophosphatase
VAIAAAHEAGALLVSLFRSGLAIERKAEQDLVTEADRRSEALILERLKAAFPDHAIVAEESGLHAAGSGYCWYVDPLDGTTNFAHGYPVFNVTLGLEKDGVMICGVVFDPNRGETFAAEKGAGAYLNGDPIRVSAAGSLNEALLSTGFPTRQRHLDTNIHFFHQMAMITHGLRRSGSAAIDLASVACGRLEGFWEFGLQPWDMAAGRLLVEEAGGAVTTMRGETHGWKAGHLLATNGRIHAETVELFGEVFAGSPRYRIPENFGLPN